VSVLICGSDRTVRMFDMNRDPRSDMSQRVVLVASPEAVISGIAGMILLALNRTRGASWGVNDVASSLFRIQPARRSHRPRPAPRRPVLRLNARESGRMLR